MAKERQAGQPSRTQRWLRSIINVVLAATLLALVSMTCWRGVVEAERRDEIRAVGDEARRLHEAFGAYYRMNRDYPAVHAEVGLRRDSLEPLGRRGYYRGKVAEYLLNARIDGYDAPEDSGEGDEYWLEMTLASDPSVRFLVTKSDDAPSGGGRWLDGVFVLQDGVLREL